MTRLPTLALASLALALGGSCSPGSEEASSAAEATAAPAALPDPAEAGLVTPEVAAEEAQEAIDASNADQELERLQREIGDG